MFVDPIVEEVRKAGKILSNECQNDVHHFAEMLKKKEKIDQKKGWKFISKKDLLSVK